MRPSFLRSSVSATYRFHPRQHFPVSGSGALPARPLGVDPHAVVPVLAAEGKAMHYQEDVVRVSVVFPHLMITHVVKTEQTARGIRGILVYMRARTQDDDERYLGARIDARERDELDA